MPFTYAHTRKPGYQYSWDWAPYLNTLGIWKDIYVLGYDSVMIDYVWARNKDIGEKVATINFAIALKMKEEASLSHYSLYIAETHDPSISVSLPLSG